MKTTCALAMFVAGCATTGMRTDFVPSATLQFDASKYPDDAALVLFRADRTELLDRGSDSASQNMRQQVFAILGEGGFDLAEVRIPVGPKRKLIYFKARIIQPDGTQKVFDSTHMLSDTTGKGERDSNAKFFRFPDVRVGSILEYAWVTEVPWYWSSDDQDTLGVFPVRRYEFELTAPKPLVLEAIEFNSSSPINVRSLADGRHQLKFELDNLPPRRKADFAPHWTFTEPRWAWRVIAYKGRAFTNDWLRDWKDVVDNKGRAFFVDRAQEKGFSENLDKGDCTQVLCKAERAMATLRQRTTTQGIEWGREESLKRSLASGKMSVVERALTLKFWLESEGVDVWLAYGTGRVSQQTSPTFPRLAQFDHLFVHLPVQPGVSQPTTIDAACDYCKVGELPSEYLGTPIFVFKSKPELSEVDTVGQWTTALGNEAPLSRLSVSHKAELRVDGTVSDEISVRAQGDSAQEHFEHHKNWPAKRLRHEQQSHFAAISPISRVESATWSTCDVSHCGWDTKVDFPREASADGARWLVPTTLLRRLWEGYFEAPDREFDVHFADTYSFDEVFDLKVPQGLELVSVPPPVRHQLKGFRVEVAFEKTAQGARVQRKVRREAGVVSKKDYKELRSAIEAFRRGRREVLVFAPSP